MSYCLCKEKIHHKLQWPSCTPCQERNENFQKTRGLEHINIEVIQILDNENNRRRLEKTKPQTLFSALSVCSKTILTMLCTLKCSKMSLTAHNTTHG